MKDKKKYIFSIVLIFVNSLYFVCMEQVTFNDLRIACCSYEEFFFVNGDGSYSGYVPDLMRSLEIYGLHASSFGYDKGKYGLSRLADGDIDFFVGAQKTSEREELFIFNKTPLGEEYMFLYAAHNSEKYYYGDIKELNGARVGLLKNNYQKTTLDNFRKKNELSLVVKTFDDRAGLFRALQTSDIDLMLVGNISILPEYKLIANLNAAPFYIAAQKSKHGAEIIKAIDAAMDALLNSEPEYLSILAHHHFESPDHVPKEFTREEAALVIASSKPIPVFINSGNSPFSYLDTKTDSFLGFYRKVLDSVSRYSGLEFNYFFANTFLTNIEARKNAVIEGIALVPLCSNSGQYKYTIPINTEHHVIISKNESSFQLFEKNFAENPNERLHVAVPRNSGLCPLYFTERHPAWTPVFYNSPLDCIKAVAKDETEAAFLNYFFVQVMYNVHEYGNLVIHTKSEPVNFYLALKKTAENSLLVSILNKAISRISDTEFLDYTTDIVFSTGYQPSLRTAAVKLIPASLLLFTLVFLIFIIISIHVDRKYKLAASIDSLTGLYTRWKFEMEAKKLLAASTAKSFAVFVIEIDRFSFINKIFGRALGDVLLKQIADFFMTLSSSKTLVGRASGAHFLLITPFTSQNEIVALAEKINSFDPNITRSDAFLKEEQPLRKILLRIGISLNGKDYGFSSVDDLIEKANQAKVFTKNTFKKYVFFDETLKAVFDLEYRVERSMETALAKGQFQVYFQPKYSIKNGVIAGAEALVRWIDSANRIILPDSFVPIFEKNGFILELDMFVYEQVFRFMRNMMDEGKNIVPISVNISRMHVELADFPFRFSILAQKYCIPPSLVEVEITESIFAESESSIGDMVAKLREFGFYIAMDDFGAGHSSLNLLGSIPIQIVKLDKQFLLSPENTGRNTVILQKVVEMSHILGIETVCEGVETAEHQAFLSSIACDLGQGFFWARPMPAATFSKWLQADFFRGGGQPEFSPIC